ncbi:MAG: hypothetical protein ACLUD2_09170 [Clostridium sp.]
MRRCRSALTLEYQFGTDIEEWRALAFEKRSSGGESAAAEAGLGRAVTFLPDICNYSINHAETGNFDEMGAGRLYTTPDARAS